MTTVNGLEETGEESVVDYVNLKSRNSPAVKE
jgi:hypothetical protein